MGDGGDLFQPTFAKKNSSLIIYYEVDTIFLEIIMHGNRFSPLFGIDHFEITSPNQIKDFSAGPGT